jgi:hypothetical protein
MAPRVMVHEGCQKVELERIEHAFWQRLLHELAHDFLQGEPAQKVIRVGVVPIRASLMDERLRGGLWGELFGHHWRKRFASSCSISSASHR